MSFPSIRRGILIVVVLVTGIVVGAVGSRADIIAQVNAANHNAKVSKPPLPCTRYTTMYEQDGNIVAINGNGSDATGNISVPTVSELNDWGAGGWHVVSMTSSYYDGTSGPDVLILLARSC